MNANVLSEIYECKGCKSRNFIEEYTGSDLICTNCGMVGGAEKIPDVEYLINKCHMTNPVDPEFLKLVDKYIREERLYKLSKKDISYLMSKCKI